MPDAKETLERYFLEMRWRCPVAGGRPGRINGQPVARRCLRSDPRLNKLREGDRRANAARANRAEQVQTIFSDKTRRRDDGRRSQALETADDANEPPVAYFRGLCTATD